MCFQWQTGVFMKKEEWKDILVYNQSKRTLCWHWCSSELAMSNEMLARHASARSAKPTGVVQSAHLISSGLERYFDKNTKSSLTQVLAIRFKMHYVTLIILSNCLLLQTKILVVFNQLSAQSAAWLLDILHQIQKIMEIVKSGVLVQTSPPHWSFLYLLCCMWVCWPKWLQHSRWCLCLSIYVVLALNKSRDKRKRILITMWLNLTLEYAFHLMSAMGNKCTHPKLHLLQQ